MLMCQQMVQTPCFAGIHCFPLCLQGFSGGMFCLYATESNARPKSFWAGAKAEFLSQVVVEFPASLVGRNKPLPPWVKWFASVHTQRVTAVLCRAPHSHDEMEKPAPV